MTGYSYSEITSDDFDYNVLLPEDTRDFFEERYKARQQGLELPNQYEAKVIKKTGDIIFTEVTTVSMGQKGDPKVLGIMRDITDRRKAEEEVKKSEIKFRELFEGINDAVFVHALTEKGFSKFIEVNETACNRLGYTREELLSITPEDISSPQDPLSEESRQGLLNLQDSSRITFETVHISKPGKQIPVEISSRVINYDGQQMIMSLARDISERKQAEKRINESYERLKSFDQHCTEGVYRVDLRTPVPINLPRAEIIDWINKFAVVGEVNGSLAEMYGLEPIDMIGKRAIEFAPDYGERAILVLEREGYRVNNEETRDVDKAGNTLYLIENYHGIIEDGCLHSIWGAQTNITDRKQLEEKYKILIESLDAGVNLISRDGTFLLLNKQAASYWDLEPAEINGKNIRDVFPPGEFLDGCLEAIERIEKTNEGITQERYLEQKDKWFHESIQPVRLETGEFFAVQVLTYDITERKQMDQILQKKIAEMDSFLNNIPDMAWLKDTDSNFIIANRKFGEVVGMAPEYLANNSCSICFGEEAAAKFKEDDLRVMDARKQTIFEESILNEKGREIFLETIKSPIFSDNNEIIGTVGISRDISERRRAEEALRKSEAKYRTIFETAANLITSVDKDGVIIECNSTITEFLGYEIEEVVGEPITKIIHPDFWERANDCLKEVFINGFSYNHENKMVHKNGDHVDIVINSSAQKDENGEYYRTLCIINNITERKKVEEALLESQKDLSDIFENVKDGIAYATLTGKIVSVNKQLEEIADVSQDKLIGKSVLKLVKDQLNAKNFKIILPIIKNLLIGKGVEPFEIEYNNKILEITTSINKSTKRVIGVVRDITESKQAENALRESMEKYRLLADNLTDVIWTRDLNLNLTYISPSTYSQSGFTVSEKMQQPLEDSMTPESFKKISQLLGQELMLEKQGTADPTRSRTFEIEMNRKDGSIYPVEISVSFLRNKDGQPKGLLGVTRDITERKLAEEELRIKNNIFESSIAATSAADIDGIINLVNPAFLRLWGYDSNEDACGKPISDFFKNKEEAAEILNSLNKTGEWKGDFLAKRKNNTTFMARGFAATLEDEKNNLIGYQSALVDVTDLTKAEDALKQSNLLNEAIINNSPIGISVRDTNGTLLMHNQTWRNIWKWSDERLKQDYKPKDELVFDFTEDYLGEEHCKELRKVYQTGGEYRIPETHLSKSVSGVDGWIQQFFYVINDESGNVDRVVIMTEDITERKQAEETLLSSEERYRSLFENMNDSFALHEIVLDDNHYPRDYIFLEVNSAYEQQTGLRREKIIGRKVTEVIPGMENDPADWIGVYGKVALTGNGIRFEQYSEPLGKWYRVLAYSTRKNHFATIFTDITERKQAEAALQKSEKRFRDMADLLPQVIFEMDLEGNLTYVNRSALDIYGYSSEEFEKGLNVFTTIAPEEHERAKGNIKKVLTGQPRKNLEFTAIRKDKTTFPVMIYSTPVLDDGKPVGLRGLVVDITDHKQAEEELRKSEQRFRNIVENSPMGVHMYEMQSEDRLVFLGANPAADILLGVDNSIFIGKTIEEAFPPLAQTEVPHRYMEAAKKGIPWGTEQISYEDDRITGAFEVAAFQTAAGKMVALFNNITKRKKAEEALKESEERYRSLFEDDVAGNYISTPDGRTLTCNPAFARIFGYDSVEEILSAPISSFYTNLQDREEFIKILTEEKKLEFYEKDFRHKEGHTLHIIENAVGVFDESGKLIQIRGYLIDNTDRKRLEDQLRQSQKMEGIGRLAGGMAHDFNNLMTSIICNAELSLIDLDSHDPLNNNMKEIQSAAERAGALTGQLLAFSRKQTLQPRVLNLNTQITDIQNMLKRTIGEDIDLNVVPGEDIKMVKADPGQIDQVIVNLVVNARDAMPKGGELTIETKNVVLDEDYTKKHPFVEPGEFVMLAVSDSGSGMTEEVRAKIFEPFFTTKPKTMGTGLGLSTVYGIIRQSNGFISVYSEVDKGTSFKIYLPSIAEEADKIIKRELNAEMPRGNETVLVVEDEANVRNAACKVLKRLGYEVTEADSGAAAFLLCQRMEKRVDLVITDVVMPYMSGAEFIEQLREMWVDVKVLFMSGYTENAIVHHGILKPGIPYIQKPFRTMDFAMKVREVLDE